jgi:SOS-response transcriptional repressor LexA
MTLEELALAVGSDTGNLSRIERGKQGFSEELLRALAAALQVAPSEFFSDESNVVPASIGSRPIPVLDYVQAGIWTAVNAESEANPTEFLLADSTLGPRAFAMRIRGDSMLPRFVEDDVVIIDPDVAPAPGNFVVAANGGDAVFKQYRLRGVNEQGQEIFELLPLNKLFPSIRSDVTPMRIIGTMIEHRTYRRK